MGLVRHPRGLRHTHRGDDVGHDYAGVLSLFLAVDGSDGVSVDVQPRVYYGHDYEPYAITDSWEVIPGRPLPSGTETSATTSAAPRSRSRRTGGRETLICFLSVGDHAPRAAGPPRLVEALRGTGVTVTEGHGTRRTQYLRPVTVVTLLHIPVFR